MVVASLVLFTVVVLALGVWTGLRQSRMERTLVSSDNRLGIRDPRDAPYGPPSSL